jgi:catechol 2,3-dioxygenase-like lactoylglutathione lyase family enzyme
MPADPLDALRIPLVPVAPRPSFRVDLLRRIEQRGSAVHDSATVRYFADDLDAAVAFYRELGFELELRPSSAFAMLYRGHLRLLLSTPASHSMADGSMPEPGGWNRISLRVDELDLMIDRLRESGVSLRSGPTEGVGVRLALIEDPAGNLVELVEPLALYHERTD